MDTNADAAARRKITWQVLGLSRIPMASSHCFSWVLWQGLVVSEPTIATSTGLTQPLPKSMDNIMGVIITRESHRSSTLFGDLLRAH